MTITTENSPPVAETGMDQTVLGDTVQLDGSGSSDVDGDLLAFTWSLTTLPEDSAATLSDPNAVMPEFSVDLPGTYVAQLIVNDGTVDSDPDAVTIITQNSTPVAEAGPDQAVFVGDTVTLDGSGSSDADGDSLGYTWAFTAIPTGSTAMLSAPNAVDPSFTVDVPGLYVIQLIVNDGTVDSDPDEILVSTLNSRPVADAGDDQEVLVGDLVQLDGSASSDADGDALGYLWSLTTVPSDSVDPTFTADLPGTYIGQLIVNDGTVDSTPDTALIEVDTDNQPPLITSTPVTEASVDQPYSYSVTATDPDADDQLT